MARQLLYLVSTLLMLSSMWPSEGAIGGEGLHLAAAWALVACYAAFRGPAARPFRLDRGVPVLLLCGGFWLSTWHVFRVEGDRRSATSLAMEWTAIGGIWWSLRFLANRHLKELCVLLVSIGFGAGCVGIVQFHVTNGMTAGWYLERQQGVNSADPLERQSAISELRKQGVPIDGTARELFERRLLASSEPTGPFALANTLGGVLTVSFVLLVVCSITTYRQGERSAGFWSGTLVLLGVLAYCLILTKSRTAWVASTSAITFFLCSGFRSYYVLLKAAVFGGIAVAIGLGVGIGTGALDKEVVLESPKSLQYRLFYWMGAAGVISESPVTGSGPGNFRQSYLKYKVAESSEEILDPHNIFADAWCSAGLPGFIAIIWILWSTLRSRPNESVGREELIKQTSKGQNPVRAAVTALSLYAAWQWIQGEDLPDADQLLQTHMLVMLIPFCSVVGWCLMRRHLVFPAQAATSALLAILIHLSGAGGLQITICGMTLIILHAIASSNNIEFGAGRKKTFSAAVWATIFGVIVLLGLIPTWSGSRYRTTAESRLAEGDYSAATELLQKAIDADPLSVISRQRNAEAQAYIALQESSRAARLDESDARWEEILEQVDSACEDWISADRRSIQGYLMRAQIYEALSKNHGVLRLIEQAVADLRHVLINYPTNVNAWARLAVLLNKLGAREEAEAAGIEALRLEGINRNWGHVDRYLSEERLQALHFAAAPAIDR